MPIPDFVDGYHLPPGEHDCTLNEIEQILLTSERRKKVWKAFLTVIDRLSDLQIKPDYIYINGSFVTGRNEPGDVDFAALIKSGPMSRALRDADEHDKAAIKDFCNVNKMEEIRNYFGAHLIVAKDNTDMNNWAQFFKYGKGGSLREPDPSKDPSWVKKPKQKGILKVTL